MRINSRNGKIEYTNDLSDDRIRQAKSVTYLKGLGSLRENEVKSLVFDENEIWEIITGFLEDSLEREFECPFRKTSIAPPSAGRRR